MKKLVIFSFALLVTAVAAPLCEEAFFRGMVFRLLSTRVPVWAAVVLSAAAFGLAPIGTFGNTGAGTLRQPTWWNLDAALDRKIAIRERLALRLRFQAFNVFQPHRVQPDRHDIPMERGQRQFEYDDRPVHRHTAAAPDGAYRQTRILIPACPCPAQASGTDWAEAAPLDAACARPGRPGRVARGFHPGAQLW